MQMLFENVGAIGGALACGCSQAPFEVIPVCHGKARWRRVYVFLGKACCWYFGEIPSACRYAVGNEKVWAQATRGAIASGDISIP